MTAELEHELLQLLRKLLVRHGYEILDELRDPRQPKWGAYAPDLVLSKDGEGIVLEAKLYRRLALPLSTVRNALDQLASVFDVQEVDRAVLVVTVPFSEARYSKLRRDPRLEVWDVSRLSQMTSGHPDLAAELADVLRRAGVEGLEGSDLLTTDDVLQPASELPERAEYYVATVRAIQKRGGQASIGDIEDTVAEVLAVTDAALRIPHGDGRRTQFQYDLAWVRTYLKWGGAIDNPERGVWTITEFGSSLSDDQLRNIWRDQVAKQRAARKLPPPPSQGPGPHFQIEDGVLSFATTVDGRGNDLRRLRSLQPLMQETIEELATVLERDRGLWPRLERALEAYGRVLTGDLHTLDFGRLFGQGVLLKRAVLAAREPGSGNSFPLTSDASALADSLLDMHAAFLMGSQDGQALLADSHQFESTRAEMQRLRASEREIAAALVRPSAPVANAVKEHVADLLASEDNDREKTKAYRSGLVRNAAIVLVGGAVFVVAGGLPALPAAATYVALLFGAEALKKSDFGKSITDAMVGSINKATVEFTKDNSKALSTLARGSHLDWLSKAMKLLPRTSLAVPDAKAEAERPLGRLAGRSLLLEASDNETAGAVPFAGTVEWHVGTDEQGGRILGAKVAVPGRTLAMDLLIRRNSEGSLPAEQLIEIQFTLGDKFQGSSIVGMPGVLLKDEELVQGVPLSGASARVVANSFLFATSATNGDIDTNNRLITSLKWMDIALIYETGRRAILTLERPHAALELFREVVRSWTE